jgi:DNA-dependent RNA polymerase auxiliary subunit epsilon
LLGRQTPPVNTKYKSGWHITWNNKKVFLRSSYELEYATFLDENKIDYDVEKLRIQYVDSRDGSKRTAIPDFYLVDSNTIVEVKSCYTLNLQNMKDKFLEYERLGYKVKLLLDKKEVDINIL